MINPETVGGGDSVKKSPVNTKAYTALHLAKSSLIEQRDKQKNIYVPENRRQQLGNLWRFSNPYFCLSQLCCEFVNLPSYCSQVVRPNERQNMVSWGFYCPVLSLFVRNTKI